MLAVKLHKKRQPFLGRKSYLIPIMSWETGKVFIKNWIKLLNRQNRNRPNNKINYMTLVRIPDNHPVELFDDWCHGRPDEWRTWEDISMEEKRDVMKWKEGRSRFDMTDELPEIIIAGHLPKACALWTKDIKLLLYGNAKNNGTTSRPSRLASRAAEHRR